MARGARAAAKGDVARRSTAARATARTAKRATALGGKGGGVDPTEKPAGGGAGDGPRPAGPQPSLPRSGPWRLRGLRCRSCCVWQWPTPWPLGRWLGLGVLPMDPKPAPCQPPALRFFRTYVGLLKHKFGVKRPTHLPSYPPAMASGRKTYLPTYLPIQAAPRKTYLPTYLMQN